MKVGKLSFAAAIAVLLLTAALPALADSRDVAPPRDITGEPSRRAAS